MEKDTWKNELDNNEFQVIWKDLSFTAFPGTSKERPILRNINGVLQSGHMVAFMGPSGCGKSTALECILQKRRIGVSGKVYLRTGKGNPCIQASFIPQSNELFNLLTVRESIFFATKIQISKRLAGNESIPPVKKSGNNEQMIESTNSTYCDALCDYILELLGLSRIANTRVDNCSGGQQKRVAIGQELPSRPCMILLDEPTSGLDSNSSYALISMLAELAKASPPIAIMLTIHQPSVKLFNLFDQAYVLARGGRCIYQGAPDILTSHLAEHGLHCPSTSNVSDYMMQVITNEENSQVLQELANTQINQFQQAISLMSVNSMKLFERKNISGSYPHWLHMMLISRRALLVTLRDPLMFLMRLSTHILVGGYFAIFYGTTIGQRGGCSPDIGDFEPSKLDFIMSELEGEFYTVTDNLCAFLFCMIFVAFSAFMPVCIAFPLELRVLTQEHENSWYSLRSYFFGRMLAEVPFQLVLPSLFAVIFYVVSSQVPDIWRMLNFVAVLIIIAFIAQSVGYLIGAYFMENITTSLFFGPASIFPVITLSGAVVKLHQLPLYARILSFISYLRFGLNAVAIGTFGFSRCGSGSNELLQANRESFQVWLAAMMGLYGDENDSNSGSGNNTQELKPNEKFVNELVDTIVSPFISSNNRVQSLAMNELNLIDEDFVLNWVLLITYFIIIRIFVYLMLRYKLSKAKA